MVARRPLVATEAHGRLYGLQLGQVEGTDRLQSFARRRAGQALRQPVEPLLAGSLNLDKLANGLLPALGTRATIDGLRTAIRAGTAPAAFLAR